MAEPARNLDGAQPQAPRQQPVGEIKIKRTLIFTPKPGEPAGAIGPKARAVPTDGITSPQESPTSGEELEQDPNQLPEPERRGESPYYQGPPQAQPQETEQNEAQNSEQSAAEQRPGADNEKKEEEQPQQQEAEDENASEPEAAQPQQIPQAVQDAEKAKELAKQTSGKMLVNWLYGFMFTLLLSIPAVIALDIYVIIGAFNKDAFWQQMGMWKKLILVLFNLLIAFLIIFVVITIIYGVCSGFSGIAIKVLGVFSSSFSFCSELQKAGVLP